MDAPQRRRKPATYGKSSRTTNFALHDVNASPEKSRPAKQSWMAETKSNGQLKKPRTLGSDSGRPSNTSLDEFEVPSEDEESVRVAVRKMAKPRPFPQRRAQREAVDLPSEQLHQEEAAAQATKQRTSTSKAGNVARVAGKAMPVQSKSMDVPGESRILPPGPKEDKSSRIKISSETDDIAGGTKGQGKLRSVVKKNQSSRARSSPDVEQVTQETSRPGKLTAVTKNRSAPEKTQPVSDGLPRATSGKRAHDDAVSSDGEGETTSSEKRPKSLKTSRRASPKTSGAVTATSSMILASRKKKQQEDTSSKLAAKGIAGTKEMPAEKAITGSARVVIPRTTRRPLPKAASTRASVIKGVSAPAKLHGMLPSPESKPSSPADVSMPSTPPRQSPGPDQNGASSSNSLPTTPPKRTSQSPFGSVTPRQNKAWTNLLGDEIARPSPSSLSFDQLKIATSSKPRPQPGLLRSSSDLPLTSHARRARLIDTLKQNTQPSSDVEDESLDSVAESESVAGEDEPFEEDGVTFSSSQAMEVDSGDSQSMTMSQSLTTSAGGPKVTYARTRSYLQESSLEDELLLSMPMDATSTKGKPELFGALRPSQLSQLIEDEDDTGGAGMRTRHELRMAGGARRMDDEMETLIDDIKDNNSISGRRIAMMELCTKLNDRAYIIRMTENGLDRRFFHSCATIKDPVLGFGFAVAVSLMVLADVPGIAFDAMLVSGSSSVFTMLLDHDMDINKIAKERRTNMSRIARESLADLRQVAMDSLWPTDKPDIIAPRDIALKNMELLIPKLRQFGVTGSFLEETGFSKLTGFLPAPLQRICTDSASPADFAVVHSVLSILEYPSMDSSVLSQPSERINESVTSLTSSIGLILGGSATLATLERKALGIIYNITIHNLAMCELFADPSVILPLAHTIVKRWQDLRLDLDEEERGSALACLTLGSAALANLAEYSGTARSAFADGQDKLLHSLAQSFLDGMEKSAQADSTEDTETSVGHGEFTVALGHLCQNRKVRKTIQSSLPHKRLDALIGQLEEFKKMHLKVDLAEIDSDENRELIGAYGARLQRVIDRLRSEAD
ncbi:hypothetical protein K490DRAFT_66210 [Saccharata proteae CBS 121410]|uniref:Wings apart-like protein C-terminal domain-containing protein n=1 Tax=Saccharata proteae CBS 121410 TaxID=1314787 RepID=A0A9P4LUV6_9PEZI|nr:hypothetical protein K490DRAFT_66210 [Saccharata proteae CBS 121410]